MSELNGIMLQSFDWYASDDGQFFTRLAARAEELKTLGVTAVWLPPVCKATGSNDVGYGIYDLYDLGEFEQKGTRRTKYGTKEELLACIDALHAAGLSVYADVVLNHKAGADRTEVCTAAEVDPQDRRRELGAAREIEAWTGFDFPGRGGRYSDFCWHWYHFSGVDFDQREGKKAIFRICGEGKAWSEDVSHENGNFDYLMFADIDYAHPEVVAEVKRWAQWFIEETGVDGFRLDAVKHIDAGFMKDFVQSLPAKSKGGRDFYVFGEYWLRDPGQKEHYLYETEYDIALFDVGLHFAFFDASRQYQNYDLRKLFDDSLVRRNPVKTVSFVDNHDTQIGQALTSWVEPWFKAMAYACILLRRDGYPCLFSADLDGCGGPSPQPSQRESLEKLLKLRLALAYGEQSDYLEDPHCIGFVRHGDEELASGRHKLAVLFSNDEYRQYAPGEEEMERARQEAALADRLEDEERTASEAEYENAAASAEKTGAEPAPARKAESEVPAAEEGAEESPEEPKAAASAAETPAAETLDLNPSEAAAPDENPWLDKSLFIRMDMGKDQAGKVFTDYFCVFKNERVVIDEDGWASFPAPARNLACWAEEGLDLDALIRERREKNAEK